MRFISKKEKKKDNMLKRNRSTDGKWTLPLLCIRSGPVRRCGPLPCWATPHKPSYQHHMRLMMSPHPLRDDSYKYWISPFHVSQSPRVFSQRPEFKLPALVHSICLPSFRLLKRQTIKYLQTKTREISTEHNANIAMYIFFSWCFNYLVL